MKKLKYLLVTIIFSLTIILCSCQKESSNVTVTFDTAGGSNINSVEINKGTSIEKPTNPTKEGYTFENWYLNDIKFDFNTTINENIILVAKWNINEYLISFDTNGGNIIDSQNVEYNSKVTKPNNPIKEGFIFDGWYLNDELYDFNKEVKSNINLVAKWAELEDEIKYKVTYHYGNNNKEEVYVYQNSKFINKDYDLSNKDGYAFDGWYTSDGIYCNEDYVILNDIDVYPNIYTDGLIIDENVVLLYTGDSTEVEIPKYYQGYIVDTIDEESFIRTKITKITLPETIKEIEKSAFEECVYLNEVNLNEGLIKIEEKAFYLCLTLSEINYPNSLEEIGSYSFSFTNLEYIIFPENIKLIDSYAFHACNFIKEVTFTGVTACEFGTTPFTYVNENLEILYTDFSIWIKNGNYKEYREDLYLREYASNIFPESKKGQYGYICEDDILLGYIKEENEEFIHVNVPEGITEIDDYSFYGNVLIETVDLPEGFTKIGKYAFYNCTSVSNIYMSSTLKEIDDYAFTGFFVGNNITRLYFPEGFERIGEGAFMSSFNLKYVEFPSTLKYIGYLAFGMSNSLERMYFKSNNVPEVGTFINNDEEVLCEIFSIVNASKTIIYVPYGKDNNGNRIVDIYKDAVGFSLVQEYIKAKPEGEEVGHYGDGNLFIDLDGCDQATIYTVVECEEDTSNFAGSKYEYKKEVGTYKLNGIRLELSFDTYGDLVAIYGNRQILFELNGTQYQLKEPKYYYDNYNWTNFVLYETNNGSGNGMFDMYGSFLTPFEWSIDDDTFKIKIDGNNKNQEHSDYIGIVEYTGTYDKNKDTFSVSFMMNDYDEIMNFTAARNNVVIGNGEESRLFGKYIVYSDETKEFAMYTLVSHANGLVDLYIGDALYENCLYTFENNVITIDFQSLIITLNFNKDGYLEGILFGQNVYFEYVDEVMDSTKLPE